jgi:opacity protein-like surface antigen
LRGGVSIATKDLVDADLKSGFGLEGMMDFRIVNHIGIYGGWAWNHFSADQSFAGNNSDFEETGYAFGVKYFETVGSSPVDAYVNVGAIYNHLEIENTAGDIIADSGHAWGWQVGAGVDINLSERWQLKPGLKYQLLTNDINLNETNHQFDLSYFNVGLGVAWRF